MSLVVFDTNAYRNCFRGLGPSSVDQRARRLRAAQQALGIQPLMTPVVALELLAHFSNPSDPARSDSITALAGAIVHCQGEFKPCGDAVIREKLFGTLSRQDEETAEAIAYAQAAVVKDFWQHGDKSVYQGDVLASLHSCADYVTERESMFVAYLTSFATVFKLGASESSATSAERRKLRMELMSAPALRCFALRRTYELAKEAAINVPDLGEAADRHIEFFRVSLEVVRTLLEKSILAKTFKPTNQPNYYWDMQIAALPGLGNATGGPAITLVSDDKILSDTFARCGSGKQAQSLQAHLVSIGF